MSKASEYIRTLRFQLQNCRTNGQSRALKGLPAGEEAEAEPSTWLAIHEFSDKPDEALVKDLKENTDGAAAEFGWGKLQHQVFVWKLVATHGEGKFF